MTLKKVSVAKVVSAIPASINPEIIMSAQPPASIFLRYDIRGIVGDTISPESTQIIGQAFALLMQEADEQSVIVAHDNRPSSPALMTALIEGLTDSGIDVINLGEQPTPLAYFATHQLNTPNALIITGSHNPPEYNGIKCVLAGKPLHSEGLQRLFRRTRADFPVDKKGNRQQADIVPDYLNRITRDVQLKRKLKVIIDCGNGTASTVAPELMRQLGCDVTALYCDSDGRFPNHHPNPSVPDNMAEMKRQLQSGDFDLGLAFDGDGDRLGVMDSSGKIIWPDRQMMLFSEDVLRRHPGASIIFDVKSSQHLSDIIQAQGGTPIMWCSGHSLLKEKLAQTSDAQLAGELSGHIFFKDRWYGFDDALYTAARLLELIAQKNQDSAQQFSHWPDAISTPELGINFDNYEKLAQFMHELRQLHGQFANGQTTLIDGIRVDFDDGWGLVRASNTTPTLVLRFEGKDKKTLKRIQAEFRQQLLTVEPKLSLPF